MTSDGMTSQFLKWVGDNYGKQIQLEMESELKRSPCDNKEALFAKFFEILVKNDVKDLTRTIKFGDIRFSS